MVGKRVPCPVLLIEKEEKDVTYCLIKAGTFLSKEPGSEMHNLPIFE
jgi:hypothetical protein